MERLTELQLRHLAIDTPNNPAVIGSVDRFDRPLQVDRVRNLLEAQLSYLPRFRQRVLPIPGHLGTPVWADDTDFDLRRQVLTRRVADAADEQQLGELAAEVLATRLPRDRPLWQLWVITGGGAGALIWKLHPALVCGPDALDPGQLLYEPVTDGGNGWPGGGLDWFDEGLDTGDTDWGGFGSPWQPEPMPGPRELLLAAGTEAAAGDGWLPRLRRAAVEGFGTVLTLAPFAGVAADAATDVVGAWVTGPPPVGSPLAGATSRKRALALRVLPAETLATVQTLLHGACDRQDHGAHHPHAREVGVIELVLAGLAEALAELPGVLAEPVDTVAILVPGTGAGSATENPVVSRVRTLPLAGASFCTRIDALAESAAAEPAGKDPVFGDPVFGDSVFGDSVFGGWPAATRRDLAVAAAAEPPALVHDLLTVEVDAGGSTIRLADAVLVGSWPVVPISAGHQLTLGILRLAGQTYLSVYADREGGPDPERIATAIGSAMMAAVRDLEEQR
ncbi:wax ester/triacylglycerol synthase domain-containing protein [Naumannella halotolerans]|uniref:wax ester/triacylglycerol synthase domain-containing protein n=1 Tax=Naumannella halotolerans TaxID=993414 RepID=UPI00370DA86D